MRNIIIKAIIIISFLMISSPAPDYHLNLVLIVLFFYQLIHDIFSPPESIGFFWYGLITIPIIVSLVYIAVGKGYGKRFLLLFSIIVLIIIQLMLDRDLNQLLAFSGFIIPFLIFILSSAYLIYTCFSKKEKTQ